MQDVTELIPDAPREVPWRTAFRARWLAGIIAIAMLPISGLAVVMVLLTGSDLFPFKDNALDGGASNTRGQITHVEESNVHDSRGSLHRVAYEFLDHTGASHHGVSMLHEQDIPDKVVIEYLAEAPDISRITGSRRRAGGDALDIVFGLCVLPGILCLLYWLRGMIALKTLLATGLVAAAKVTEKKTGFGVNPPQWRVHYEFITSTGLQLTGSHWVGQRSALGKALARDDRCAVIYDELIPEKSRLVIPVSFNP